MWPFQEISRDFFVARTTVGFINGEKFNILVARFDFSSLVGSVTNPVGPPETLNKNHQTSEVQNGMDFFLPPKKEKTPWVLKHIFGV